MRKTWARIDEDAYTFHETLARQTHLLIGGTTGSGKSVVINGLIYRLLQEVPGAVQLILIDPKRVELSRYKKLPHVLRYAWEPSDCIDALNDAMNIMLNRLDEMERNGWRETKRGHVYIIVDEFLDLMQAGKKAASAPVVRLATLGRAAHIHLVLATQRPTRDVIDGKITANLTGRVALRCSNPQESRNIIDVRGAEWLPLYGDCLFREPGREIIHYSGIPLVPDSDIDKRIAYWMEQAKPRLLRFLARKKAA